MMYMNEHRIKNFDCLIRQYVISLQTKKRNVVLKFFFWFYQLSFTLLLSENVHFDVSLEAFSLDGATKIKEAELDII